MHHNNGKGWRPDLPDKRDRYYHVSHFFQSESRYAVPNSVDLRPSPAMPAIEDQGQLGSCTAFGTLAAYNFMHAIQTGKNLEMSHLFQYYNSRLIEGTVSEDSGATIRDAVKAVVKYGAIPETMLPYNIAKFKHHPTAAEYAAGLKHQAIQYLRVENDARRGGLAHCQASLAAGFPIIFGATLYESFENPGPDANGFIPMPGKKEQVLGGHCQLIVGYDNSANAFIVRNSWGSGWALEGYEYIPYAYLLDTDLATDFWTLRKINV